MLHLYERHRGVQGAALAVLTLFSQTLHRQMVETVARLPSVQATFGHRNFGCIRLCLSFRFRLRARNLMTGVTGEWRVVIAWVWRFCYWRIITPCHP